MAIAIECVGLDVGQTGLKAVRFRRRLSGRETIDYFHQPMPFARPQDLEPARRAQALRGFLWRHGLYATDQLVTAIPCHDLFVRTLSLPFMDSAKLAQIVPFEMEHLVPMPLEDLAIGSLVLPPIPAVDDRSGAHRVSEVLVTAAPKDKVAEHLRFLAQADIEPSAINVDALALFSVTEYLRKESPGVPRDLAIIDIGASKTTLCLIHEGRPIVLRTILWGGNQLTQALAERQACSFADAERLKRRMTVDQVEGWMEPLFRDLHVTLQAYEGAHRGRLTYCWVSGGGSKLQDIGGFLAKRLGLYLVGPRQGFGIDSPRAFSIAFGLAIHPKIVKPRWRFTPPSERLALDLKSATGAGPGKAGASQSKRRLAAGAALVIGLLATADFSIHLALQDQRVSRLKSALQTQFEQAFASTAAPGDELDQARYRIEALEKTLAIVEGTQGKILPTLSAFVKQLPAGTPVKVRELTVEGREIHMEGETTSFDAVEKIKQSFTAGSGFEEVSVADTRVGSAPNQVVFRMTVTVRRP